MLPLSPEHFPQCYLKNQVAKLGSDHLTSRGGGGGGGFEKNILALIFVKKNILASTQTKKNSLTLGMRKKITALLRDTKNQLSR